MRIVGLYKSINFIINTGEDGRLEAECIHY